MEITVNIYILMPPRKAPVKTNQSNPEFNNFMKEWLEITNKIIELEQQLEPLREKQKELTSKGVGLIEGLKETELVVEKKPASRKTTPKKPVTRTPRKTKAQIEAEKKEEELKKQQEEEKKKQQEKKTNVIDEDTDDEDNNKSSSSSESSSDSELDSLSSDSSESSDDDE